MGHLVVCNTGYTLLYMLICHVYCKSFKLIIILKKPKYKLGSLDQCN